MGDMQRLVRQATIICAALATALGMAGAAHAAPDPAAVGVVADIGGLKDRSFNQMAAKGVQRAVRTEGARGTVLETKRYADMRRNLDSLAAAGNGLVIGVGFLMSDALKESAAAAPDTRFAIIDFSFQQTKPRRWSATDNVTGVTFDSWQAGYVAGALAGTVERRSGPRMNRKRIVSAIGGQRIPPVTSYINGFRAGVRRTCSNCLMITSYSNDFVDQAKCRSKARAQIKRGSDIILVAAGGCGHGAFREIRTRGVWGIGVDADQSYLGSHILTSAIKRVDVAVLDLFIRSKTGQLEGGTDLQYGVAENGVGIGRVAASARRYSFAARAAVRDLKNGKVRR